LCSKHHEPALTKDNTPVPSVETSCNAHTRMAVS
jgi:hypothetical protein